MKIINLVDVGLLFGVKVFFEKGIAMLKRAVLLSVFACGFVAVFGIPFAGSSAQAATYYWTTQAGTMSAGSGLWDAATANWSLSNTGDNPLSAWTPGSNADFLANGASTVSVNGNQSVGGITFDGTGYTLGGTGTLSLSGSVTANQIATIGCILGGSNGFIKGGVGQVTWSSTGNAITGTMEVTAGTLNVFTPHGDFNNGVFNNATSRTWQVDPGATLVFSGVWAMGQQRRLQH